MSTLELPPPQQPLQEDWQRFERRSARRGFKATHPAQPAAVWINRPALHSRAWPRSLVALLTVSLLAGALWSLAY